MLYLLKASRIAEYRQQNVAILGADEGERFTIRYGHRWVQPGLSANIGDGCMIVFADTPYKEFVPVRFAKVTRFESIPDHVEIEVALGSWVHTDDPEALSRRWRDRADADRPGKPLFLFTGENPGLGTPSSPDELDSSLSAVVGNLGGNNFLACSVIARFRHFVTAEGTPIDAETPVHAGDTVHAVLDMLSPTVESDAVRIVADFKPGGAGEIAAGSTVRVPGQSLIPIHVLAPGECRVRIRFLPDPLQSSRPVFALNVLEPEAERAAPPVADRVAPRLERLVERLQRDAQIAPEVWIGLFEDVLLDWAPHDAALLERYAGHLFALESFEKAVQVLGALEERSPEGDQMLVISSIRSGEPFDADTLLPRIDLAADGPFRELLEALAGAGNDVWRQLLDLLPHKLLGDDKSHAFVLAAREHVSDERSRNCVAETIAFVDSELASSFAMESWPDPETAPPRIVELLIELGANRAHLLPYVKARLATLAGDGAWEEFELFLARARRELREDDHYLATARAARLMLRSGDVGIADRGLGLEIEATREAIANGDLDTALRAATIAHTYALTRKNSTFETATKDLVATVEEAIRRTELFRRYEEAGLNQRAERRKAWLSGKRLHIVGGLKADWKDAIRVECGLAEVRWYPAEKHKAPKLDWADHLTPDSDVVVCLIDHVGHKTSKPLKDLCTKRKVPHVPADWGKQSVLEALAESAGAAQ